VLEELGMHRHLCIAFIATLVLVGCDKGSKDSGKDPASAKPGSAAPVTDKAAPPAAPVAAPAPAPAPTPAPAPVKPAEPAQPVEDKVLALGVLDLEMVEHGKLFILHDEAYELAFPIKPAVQASDQVTPSGVKLHAASALATNDSDIYGLFVIPIPKGVPYDVKKGLNGARDGALKNINAKLVSEINTTFGGLKGRKATGAATLAGKDLKLDLYLAYDKAHHTMIGLFIATTQAAMPKEAGDFIASFKVNPDGEAPPAGNGT
jgi:hypothetical protein